MKRWMVIVIVALLVVGLAAVRMKRAREKDSGPLARAVPAAVQVVPVTRSRVVATRHIMGNVVADNETEIAPRIMAQVLEVRVREGDVVHRGEVLARLDPRELEDAVAEAEAGVQAAREGLTAAEVAFATERDATARDGRLFEAKAVSQEQWDRSRASEAAAAARLESAKSQVQVASRRLNQARIRLGYTQLKAPFDGVVAARMADPGDLATPGRPLLHMIRPGKIRVRAEAPPEDREVLKPGLAVTLVRDGQQIPAEIARVLPAMGRNHLAAFEVDLAEPPVDLVSGLTIDVEVHLGAAEGLTVPVAALLESDSGTRVFAVEDDTVRAVAVEVVERSLDQAVITGDITAGEEVVVGRPARLMALADGMKVRPSEG